MARSRHGMAGIVALVVCMSSLVPLTSTSASGSGATSFAWTGRWDVEGDTNEDGVFEHFGVLEFELVTDGSLDHLHTDPDGSCAESDRKFRGTYKFGTGGVLEMCEIAAFDHELFGEYYGNDGYWGQANMAFETGSPDKWAGYHSPPTDGQHPNQAYLPWRATRVSEQGCAAPAKRSGPAHLAAEDESCIDPVIFIPGFLGTEIGCPKSDHFDELWPDAPTPEFFNMRLGASGARNHPKGNTCNRNAEPGPVIWSAFGTDVYGGMRKYLRSLEGVKSYFFGYDWRMSPGNPTTQSRLDKLVNRARVETGRKKVTLVAHSMGGLVARWYVGENPAKVARVATMGTPYWGAPKPWLALKHGLTGPPGSGWMPDLDSFIPDGELKAFARNAYGAFFLYPSPAYYQQAGGWLSWAIHGPGTLDMQKTLDAVASAKGNRKLYEQALALHTSKLDSYGGTSSIPWQIIVGTGLPTLTHVTETDGEPVYTYGNGDGTVPLPSATQGKGSDETIVHYVCGIDHAALPGAEEVQLMIRDYLLFGGSIPNPHPGGCPAP